MNREEAARVLEEIWKRYTSAVDDIEEEVDAIFAAIDALLGPQPDPKTGLVPCGCGGKAVFDSAYGDDEVESSYTAEVYCELCEIRTPIFRENADAKAAWNRAMGRQEMRQNGEEVEG